MQLALRTSLAIALVATAAPSAHARITSGGLNSNGELFLIAFDPVSQNTFVKDLGPDWNTLVANTQRLDWFTPVDLGALVTPGTGPGRFNFGDGVEWNIAVQNRVSNHHSRENNGFFSTVNRANSTALFERADLQAFGGLGPNINNASNRVGEIQSAITSKIGFLNQELPGGDQPLSIEVTTDGHFVALNNTNQSYHFAWSDDFNNRAVHFSNAGTVGIDDELLFFQFWRVRDDQGVHHVLRQQQAGAFRLSAAGVLTYQTPIPLPAAAWLLGPAVLATLLKRRRRVLNLA